MRRDAGRVIVWLLLAVVAAETGWLAYPKIRDVIAPPEETAAVRGERLAHEFGCFACHGAGGNGGTANPTRVSEAGKNFRTLGSEGEVPAFTENTQMMYVKTTDDIREYILDGAPKRRREDPQYKAKMDSAAIRMPAYRGVVGDAQLADLVAYLRATSGQLSPDDKLASHGAELAATLGCFSCHGPLGAGGVPNPRSFKGYIPGFWGADFDELVKNDEELRTWIEDGKLERIAAHPIGKIFFEGQMLKMPAYEDYVQPADLDALVAYVRWIHDGSWHDQLQ